MTTFSKPVRVVIVLAAAASFCPMAHAQLQPKESIPGGVESRPSAPAAGEVPKVVAPPAPAPARAAPPPQFERAPAAPIAKPPPAKAPPAKDTVPKADEKKPDDKKGAVKPKPSLIPNTLAPGAVAPPVGAPAPIFSNESKPGAVERAPTSNPAPKQ